MKLHIECPSCNGSVNLLEPHFHSVYLCPHCKRPIERVYALAKRPEDMSKAARVLTTELRKDVEELFELGITVEKGVLGTQAGGMVGAGLAAYSGHWLVALVAGAASLFANSIGNSYKRIKLHEFQLKWLSAMNQLDQSQSAAFLEALLTDCPIIAAQLPALLSPAE